MIRFEKISEDMETIINFEQCFLYLTDEYQPEI